MQDAVNTSNTGWVYKIAHVLDRSIYRLNVGVGNILSVMLILLAIFVTGNVIARWVGTSSPLLFSGSIVILIAFAYLTSAYALGEGKHVSVDAVTSYLPNYSKLSLEILGYVFVLAFSILLGVEGTQWVLRSYYAGISLAGSLSLGTFPANLWMVAAPVPIGAFLLILQSLRLIVKKSAFLKAQHPGLLASLLPMAIVLVVFGISIFVAVNVNSVVGLFMCLLTLFFAGVPVAFALGSMGAIGLYLFAGGAKGLLQVPISAFGSMESFPAVAFPLFILIGSIIGRAGLAEALCKFAESWLGRIRGSMLMVTVASGAIVDATTGSSAAAHAILCTIYVPVLRKRGYNMRLAIGTIAGSAVGTLIPPSATLILFGIITGASLGQLFMAVIAPAAVTFIIYFAYIFILSYARPKLFGERPPAVTFKEKLKWTQKSIPVLLLPLLILGGVYVGFFTVTEVAGVAVVYGLIATLLITRTLKPEGARIACLEGCYLSAMSLWILIGGLLFANVIAQLQVGPHLVAWVQTLGITRLIVFVMMFVILMFLGMFISVAPLLLISVPLFMPVAQSVGISPLWLGVFFTYMGEIALLTPPVATNLFIIQGASGLPFKDVVMGILPFLGFLMLSVVIIFLFPQLVTWIPGMMVSR